MNWRDNEGWILPGNIAVDVGIDDCVFCQAEPLYDFLGIKILRRGSNWVRVLSCPEDITFVSKCQGFELQIHTPDKVFNCSQMADVAVFLTIAEVKILLEKVTLEEHKNMLRKLLEDANSKSTFSDICNFRLNDNMYHW